MSTVMPDDPSTQPPDGGSRPPNGAAVAAALATICAFIAPTLAEPAWTPYVRALAALVVVAALGVIVWWLVNRIRHRRRM